MKSRAVLGASDAEQALQLAVGRSGRLRDARSRACAPSRRDRTAPRRLARARARRRARRADARPRAAHDPSPRKRCWRGRCVTWMKTWRPCAPVYRSGLQPPARPAVAARTTLVTGGARLHSPAARPRQRRRRDDAGGSRVLRRLTLDARLAASAAGLRAAPRPASGGRPATAGRCPPKRLYANASGALGILNTAGTIDTRNHPFFAPLGTNGRGCVTCHQPADAMALSVATVRERWEATGGPGSAVRRRRRPQLSASAGRRSGRAFAAADTRARSASHCPGRRAMRPARRCPSSSRSRSSAIRRAATRIPSTACSRRSRPCRCIGARGPSRTRSI